MSILPLLQSYDLFELYAVLDSPRVAVDSLHAGFPDVDL